MDDPKDRTDGPGIKREMKKEVVIMEIQSVYDVENLNPEDLTLEEWQQIAVRLSRMLKARTEECKKLNMELTLLKLERDCDNPGTLH